MNWIKNNINKIYATCSIFTIPLYILTAKLILKYIDNYCIRISLLFFVFTICTFVPRLLKHKLSKDSNNKTESGIEIILDVLSILAICVNVYMIAYFISSKTYPIIQDFVSSAIMLFFSYILPEYYYKKIA